MTEMRIAIVVVASSVLSFFLMRPLGMLFDAMNWPIFHAWGLVHGSFLIAWPLASGVVMVRLLPVPMKSKERSNS